MISGCSNEGEIIILTIDNIDAGEVLSEADIFNLMSYLQN